jgi:hypothetical protein
VTLSTEHSEASEPMMGGAASEISEMPSELHSYCLHTKQPALFQLC